MSTTFKNLGPGLGFRPAHYHEILRDRPKTIGWLEVITENFMNIGGKPRDILMQAREHYPIAFHGVGMSIGSDDDVSPKYLQQLKDLVQKTKPTLVSDHLCFTSHGRHNSHDLLPIPFTKVLLKRISDRVNRVQDLLGQRFMLENPSAYVAYATNDMREADFFAELITRTGCAILLDLNNLYVNQMNLGEHPLTYLKTIPADAVGQIHLAGHSTEETEWGTVRIDTHDHAIREEVWSLYGIAKKIWPNASTMVEWDDHLPELSELLPLLERIRKTEALEINGEIPNAHKHETATSPASILGDFFAMAVDSNGIDDKDARLAILSDASPVPRRLGMQVYSNAYFARLRDILHDEFPTLAGVTTEEGFTALAASYLQAEPPSEPSVNRLGRNLAAHLRRATIDDFDFGVDLLALADIAAIDDTRSATFIHAAEDRTLQLTALAEISPEAWEKISFVWNPTLVVLGTTYDVAPVWAAVHNDKMDELKPPHKSPTTIRVWRHEHTVHHQVMDDREATLLAALSKKQPFSEATTHFAAAAHLSLEDATAYAVTTLAAWIQQGLVAGIDL